MKYQDLLYIEFQQKEIQNDTNFKFMTKEKKKNPKEASNIFHSIMAASVKGNPKPKQKEKKVVNKKKINE